MSNLRAPTGQNAFIAIDGVLRELEAVVAEARASRDRLGYFAALYCRTTATVGRGVQAGVFDDAERMERFVERFAARYLGPLRAWQAGRTEGVPRSWRAACAAASQGDKVILQHLLLGVNAHINLDLGVVAAEIAPGQAIHGLKHDFGRINDILASLLQPVRGCIGRFSPLLDVIDRVGGGEDDEVLNFSIRVGRHDAWSQAVTLAQADPARCAELIDSLDRRVAVLAKVVANPGGLLQRAVDVVAATESDNVVKIIDAIGRVPMPAA